MSPCYSEGTMTKPATPASHTPTPVEPNGQDNQERTSNISVSLDDVRVVYQAAIAAYIYEGGQVWARFNAFLVMHGILIVIIGQFFLSTDPRAQFLAAIISGIGLIVSL